MSAAKSSGSSLSLFRSHKSPAPPSSSRPPIPPSFASSKPLSWLSATPANSSIPSPNTSNLERPETSKPKENATIMVRFRPLSHRENNKGDEIAWYADGDCTVRSEYNPSIVYAFGCLLYYRQGIWSSNNNTSCL